MSEEVESSSNGDGESTVIHMLYSVAPLLSGRSLWDCVDANDTSCEGGISAVSAFFRHQVRQQSSSAARLDASLLIPEFDKDSQFAQVHPLQWTVNRLVLEYHFQFPVFTAPPSLLLQHKDDFAVARRDISGLQSPDFPYLLSNAYVPPSVSWSEYARSIYFHENTSIALMYLKGRGEPLTAEASYIDVATAQLEFIHEANQRSGCITTTHSTSSAYQEYLEQAFPQPSVNPNNAVNNETRCWIPIAYYEEIHDEEFASFANTVSQLPFPPALIVQMQSQLYPTIQRHIVTNNHTYNTKTWVVSQDYGSDDYYHFRMTVDPLDRRYLSNVSVIYADVEVLPQQYKDEQYQQDIAFMHQLAMEASSNDAPIGTSTFMPVARNDPYRRCLGGECEIGNLFADALRWQGHTDIAFVTSGGLRGNGWLPGSVTLGNIWEALPFPNTICTGKMTGLSLFRVVQFSIDIATFVAHKTTGDGGYLFQFSGINVVYNTQLPTLLNNTNSSRLISMHIWDHQQAQYIPVERLKLYTFATDSFVCGGYDPYPSFLNEQLTLEGEIPGSIGEELVQNIVADYLSQLGRTYDASIQGRLVNDTNAMEALNLEQTKESCLGDNTGNFFWVQEELTCKQCPNSSQIAFSDSQLEFQAESLSPKPVDGRVILVNRELTNFSVALRNFPNWLQFTKTTTSTTTTSLVNDSLDNNGENNSITNFTPSNALDAATPYLLTPGESLGLDFMVAATALEPGTALGTVSFAILGAGTTFDCVYSRDVSFDVLLRVFPRPELLQLGSIRYVGLALMAVVVWSAIFFAAWVHKNRQERIIKTMQPIFLVIVCCGVVIIGLTIVPLSFLDGTFSTKTSDILCMIQPWMLNLGSTIVFSAIYSKLLRINTLFNNPNLRRVTVSERDALKPFAGLFGASFTILLGWTLVDPLHWKQKPVSGQEWKTFGICGYQTIAGTIFLSMITLLNLTALLMAGRQAYKAREISEEFSESKNIGLAVYTWLQVIFVAVPVMFLIDRESQAAFYFLNIGILFVLSMSMMLNLFVPLMVQLHQFRNEPLPVSRLSSVVSGVGNRSSFVANSMEFQTTNASVRNSRRFSVGGNVHVSGLSASALASTSNLGGQPPWEMGKKLSGLDLTSLLEESYSKGQDNDNSTNLDPIDDSQVQHDQAIPYEQEEAQERMKRQEKFHQQQDENLTNPQEQFRQQQEELVKQQEQFRQQQEELVKQQQLLRQQQEELVQQQQQYHQQNEELVQQQQQYREQHAELMQLQQHEQQQQQHCQEQLQQQQQQAEQFLNEEQQQQHYQEQIQQQQQQQSFRAHFDDSMMDEVYESDENAVTIPNHQLFLS